MTPTEKYRLVQDIYFTLQSSYNTDEILHILKDYNIESHLHKTYTQDAIKSLIAQASEKTIKEIAADLKLSTGLIQSAKKEQSSSKTKPLSKIFIIHDKQDKAIIESFIQLLQGIGIKPENIFCSSLEGYGTPLGININEDIKMRLKEDVLVLFMVSDHFYNSSNCMIQMGAAWALTKDQISITIPPFDPEKLKGVIQNLKGILINDTKQLDLFKETIEHKFEIKTQKHLHWEPKRNMVVRDINIQLPTDNEH